MKGKKSMLDRIVTTTLAIIIFALGTYIAYRVGQETITTFWKKYNNMIHSISDITFALLIIMLLVCATFPPLLLILLLFFLVVTLALFVIWGLGIPILIEILIIIISFVVLDLPNIEKNRKKRDKGE